MTWVSLRPGPHMGLGTVWGQERPVEEMSCKVTPTHLAPGRDTRRGCKEDTSPREGPSSVPGEGHWELGAPRHWGQCRSQYSALRGRPQRPVRAPARLQRLHRGLAFRALHRETLLTEKPDHSPCGERGDSAATQAGMGIPGGNCEQEADCPWVLCPGMHRQPSQHAGSPGHPQRGG